MKRIAAKAIKQAIEQGKHVELIDATFSTYWHDNDAHYISIDGVEYETSTRSANMVRSLFSTSYTFTSNCAGKGKNYSSAKYWTYQVA